MRHFTPMQGESGQFGSRCHHKMNVLRLQNPLYNMSLWKMNASPKLCFFWTVCKTIVLTGTLKLKIPQNLQTWKVLTQILHLVVYTIPVEEKLYMYVLIFKPNCSTIFRCACTKTSDTYIVYILFLIQLHIHTRKIRHARSLKTHQIKIDSVKMWCTSLASLRVETSCHRGKAVKDRIRNLCM